MLGFFDTNVILTGTVETKTDTYYCDLCGDEKTRTTVISSSDWQAHGISNNIGYISVREKLMFNVEGDCQYVVVEQSNTTDFSIINKAKVIWHGSTKVKIHHRYVRAFIMGGTKTMVFIGERV